MRAYFKTRAQTVFAILVCLALCTKTRADLVGGTYSTGTPSPTSWDQVDGLNPFWTSVTNKNPGSAFAAVQMPPPATALPGAKWFPLGETIFAPAQRYNLTAIALLMGGSAPATNLQLHLFDVTASIRSVDSSSITNGAGAIYTTGRDLLGNGNGLTFTNSGLPSKTNQCIFKLCNGLIANDGGIVIGNGHVYALEIWSSADAPNTLGWCRTGVNLNDCGTTGQGFMAGSELTNRVTMTAAGNAGGAPRNFLMALYGTTNFGVIVNQTTWPAAGSAILETNQNRPDSLGWQSSKKPNYWGSAGSMVMSNQTGSTTFWAYFSDSNAPITIGVGQMLRATAKLIFTNVIDRDSLLMTAPAARGFRWGLARSSVFQLPLTNGTGSSLRSMPGYCQIMNFATRFTLDGPLQLFAWTNEPGASPNALFATTGADAIMLGSVGGGHSNDAGFIDGVPYTFSMTVARTNTSSVDITTTISGANLLNGGISQTVTDTNYAFTCFDTFSIRPASTSTTCRFITMTAFKVEKLSTSVLPIASVTFGDLSQAYDGTARSVSVATLPPGLVVDVTYNGSLNAPTNAGIYTVIATINDPNYQGWATNTLVVMRRMTAGDATYTRAPGLSLRIAIATLLSNVSSLPGDHPALSLARVGPSGQGATIVTNSDSVLYLPVNDSTDSFSYTAIDETGGSATGNVMVTVVKAFGQSLSANTISLSGSTATITAFGIPRFTYVLQTATNVGGLWWPVGTNIAGSDGSLMFLDPNATNSQQYYRIAQP